VGCCSCTGCSSSTSTRTASSRWPLLKRCERGSSASTRTGIYSSTSSGSPALGMAPARRRSAVPTSRRSKGTVTTTSW
jgi:hypothetical protein